MEHFQEERLNLAVGSVCGAQNALDLAAEYAKERVQFGRAIASFQVTRHKIADMATEIEAARQLVYNTIRLYVEKEECQSEVAMCKLFACEMAGRRCVGIELEPRYCAGTVRRWERFTGLSAERIA